MPWQELARRAGERRFVGTVVKGESVVVLAAVVQVGPELERHLVAVEEEELAARAVIQEARRRGALAAAHAIAKTGADTDTRAAVGAIEVVFAGTGVLLQHVDGAVAADHRDTVAHRAVVGGSQQRAGQWGRLDVERCDPEPDADRRPLRPDRYRARMKRQGRLFRAERLRAECSAPVREDGVHAARHLAALTEVAVVAATAAGSACSVAIHNHMPYTTPKLEGNARRDLIAARLALCPRLPARRRACMERSPQLKLSPTN